MSLPRGATAGAAAEAPAMNIVRGWTVPVRSGSRGTDARAAGAAEREAHLHGLATIRAAQVATGGGAACRSDRRGGRRGWMPPAPVTRGAGVGPARGFGGS